MDNSDELERLINTDDESNGEPIRTGLSRLRPVSQADQTDSTQFDYNSYDSPEYPTSSSRRGVGSRTRRSRGGLWATLLLLAIAVGTGVTAYLYLPAGSLPFLSKTGGSNPPSADAQEEPQNEVDAAVVKIIEPIAPVANDAIAPPHNAQVLNEFQIDVIENATVGTALIDPASVMLEGLALTETSRAPAASLSEDRRMLTVAGEGIWSVDGNGVITFTGEEDFVHFPTPIFYRLADVNELQSNTAKVLENPVVKEFSSALDRLNTATDEEFWSYYKAQLIDPYPSLDLETILVINRILWRATRDEMGVTPRNRLLAKAEVKKKSITNMFTPWAMGGFTVPDLWNIVSLLEVVDLTSTESPKPAMTGPYEDRFIRLDTVDKLIRNYTNEPEYR